MSTDDDDLLEPLPCIRHLVGEVDDDDVIVDDCKASISSSEHVDRIDPSVEIEVYSDSRGYMRHFVTIENSGLFRLDPQETRLCYVRRLKYKLVLLGVCFILIILPASIVPARRKRGNNEDLQFAASNSAETLTDFGEGYYDGKVIENGFWDSTLDGNLSLSEITFGPFSQLDPISGLGLPTLARPSASSPSARLDPLRSVKPKQPLPTNAWYQNILLLKDNQSPTKDHGAYAMPYIVDTAGIIPGVRVHHSKVETTTNQIIVGIDEPVALTLGATQNVFGRILVDPLADKGYSVVAATDLGITLQWAASDMRSSLVRGMPYATMSYPTFSPQDNMLPTIYAERILSSPPLVDGSREADCTNLTPFEVTNDIELFFQSGLTWLGFFSQPVKMQCRELGPGGPFVLQVVDFVEQLNRPLVIRLGMVLDGLSAELESGYKEQLRRHANAFPGVSTKVRFAINNNTGAVLFDWDVQTMDGGASGEDEMIMFAMPHHQDRFKDGVLRDFCKKALLGFACLVKGSTWTIPERLPHISFRAPRRPEPAMLPSLSAAAVADLNYRIPDNFFIGAGDTYFSGKALGKLARIILISKELLDICKTNTRGRVLRSLAAEGYDEACARSSLPANSAINDALDHLRQGVEVWLNGAAQAPFLYDPAWGGVVNCGCDFYYGTCRNTFPNCPGLIDQGLNFGLGFYNDHHFHYGYHIYAAAVVASFDAAWGKDHFEKVLLLVRDVANPSTDDTYFPLTRHKDWYHGSSWASGITQPLSPTGMNQESSSEAIASYEAIALFGRVMQKIFNDGGDEEKAGVSSNIYEMGRFLTSTELRSTKRYWQISHNQESRKVVDPVYEPNVVGILWSSKAFFGTWFGNRPYLIYGIQLLPLTPIAEERDDPVWAREMFDPYAQACDGACVAEGWSVQLLAILATLGQKEKAADLSLNLTPDVFETAGGNGHSMSNTLWYIATRPTIKEPYIPPNIYAWETGPVKVTCSKPDLCTETYLKTQAGEYDCGSRISYLINAEGKSEYDACRQIAVDEYPEVCGLCNPLGEVSSSENVLLDPEVTSEDEETIIDDILAGADVPPPAGWRCNQPSCTADVLLAAAGSFQCGERIDWLMLAKSMPENEACRIVAVNEFPDQCGGCRPGNG